MEGFLTGEGYIYHAPRRTPKVKLKVELVVTRIIFKQSVKTFWWSIRLEGTKQTLLSGRLGVTSMQAAVRAARHFVKHQYKITRTFQESYEHQDIALEEWHA